MFQKYEMNIKELEDILENPGYNLLVMDGTSDADHLQYSHLSSYKEIWKNLIKSNGNMSTLFEILPRLLKSTKNVYFGISPEIELISSVYPCLIVRSKKSYFSRSGSYVFRKDSPYIDLFSHQTQKIQRMGLTTEFDKTMRKEVKCFSDSEKYFRGLSFNDLTFFLSY